MGAVEAPPARTSGAAPPARTSGAAPPARTSAGAAPPTPALVSKTEPLLPQLGEWENPDPLGVLAATLEPPAPAIQPRRTRPTDAHTVPRALRALIAELGPVADPPRLPVSERLHLKPATEPPLAQDRVAMSRPKAANAITKPFGAKLLPQPGVAATPAAPATPGLGLAPALAPLVHYDPLEGHPLRPSAPPCGLRKNACGPRLTVAGPALIKALVRFEDQALHPIPVASARKPGKPLAPKWLTGAMIIGAVMAVGLNGVFSLATRPAAEAKPSLVEAAPAMPVQPASAASPLSKAIEVTGFRIQMDPEKKAEIQYLVVNHTANTIAGVTVYVTLRTANAAAGQAPLAKFQLAAPNLGAYQAKEMASAIERVTRPIALPDWQDLRADIEIGQ